MDVLNSRLVVEGWLRSRSSLGLASTISSACLLYTRHTNTGSKHRPDALTKDEIVIPKSISRNHIADITSRLIANQDVASLTLDNCRTCQSSHTSNRMRFKHLQVVG